MMLFLEGEKQHFFLESSKIGALELSRKLGRLVYHTTESPITTMFLLGFRNDQNKWVNFVNQSSIFAVFSTENFKLMLFCGLAVFRENVKVLKMTLQFISKS